MRQCSCRMVFCRRSTKPLIQTWRGFVRERHLVPLSEAIRKMTSLPAQRQHLADRGLLKPGFYADITVFNPATVKDMSTYQRPDALSTGIEDVLVNGQLEFAHGRLTGKAAGRPLHGRGWTGAGRSRTQPPGEVSCASAG